MYGVATFWKSEYCADEILCALSYGADSGRLQQAPWLRQELERLILMR
jgi:hypothetical protein